LERARPATLRAARAQTDAPRARPAAMRTAVQPDRLSPANIAVRVL